MIIVTGAGGNVGRQLVSRLKEAGAPLRACFNSARKAAEARAAGVGAAVVAFAQPGAPAPARDCRISFIDVRDIAAVAAAVLVDAGHEGKAYGLSGPEAPTHAEIAEKFSRALGKPVRYVDLPDDDYVRALEGFGLPSAYA